MAWSTPDLSDITNVLKGLVQTALNTTSVPIGNVSITCNSPETSRKDDGYCHLSLYLLHIGRDPTWRNTPVDGPRPQLNRSQPLSLNLSYLLSAWCDADFTREQRAMSVALQAIHSQPVVTHAVMQADSLTQFLPEGEFTMSIEADTIEEMSRLWQAFTAPMRLSALIRVGVVFMAPALASVKAARTPVVANLSVAPQPDAATVPLLFAGGGVDFQPVLPDAPPAQVVAGNGPLTAVGGGTLRIAGNGLDLASGAEVFLSVPGTAAEWRVTAPWRLGAASPARLDLVLPAAYADPATTPPPAATPLPGLYALRVGTVAPPWRSNAIPLIIAPRLDNVTYPPRLTPDGTGLYSIAGAGFVPATTIMAVGALPLAKTTAAVPGAGEFTVNGAGTAIAFRLPTPAPANGSYPVLIQVNGIAAAAGWVVVLPP